MKSEVQFSLNSAAVPRDIDGKLVPFAEKRLRLPAGTVEKLEIINKSIDSRKAPPQLIYRAVVTLPDSFKGKLPEYVEKGNASVIPENVWRHSDSPIIIGTGPAGLFAGLYLALAGAKPVILDRGFPVPEREERYKKFLAGRRLDPESNLLIGEGGAGTFSDGKLYTGTKSPFARRVIEEFISAGAPPETGYLARPHIGSDYLKRTIPALREKIISLGGSFRFNSKVTDLAVRNGVCTGVILDNGEKLTTSAGVILACGLGGRELIRKITQKAEFSLKSFQLGCRIEHPQEFIDLKQYKMSRPQALGAAEYHIVSRPKDAPGVSSFCMCPGGRIVNATAWENASITNGVSDFARDGKFANSCLISTITLPESFRMDEIFAAMENIEKEQFLRGGSDYAFPCQSAEDFLRRKATSKVPDHACETGIVPGRIDDLLPKESFAALAAALKHFDRLMPGFIKYGKFIGVESCVSSPVRILRDENCESSLKKLFPAGEGPGLAGGIISAACDGMRCAENLLRSVHNG